MKEHPGTRNVHCCLGRFGLGLSVCLLLFFLGNTQAAIVGPYSVDADTLQLWHLNESAVPALNATAGTNLAALGGGATLGNPAYPGFGSALSTAAGTSAYLAARPLASSTADDTYLAYANPDTGEFTVEALVRVDFNPATFNRGNAPLYIVTAENDGSANRPFQLRMHTNGVAGSGVMILHLFNSTGNSGAAVPIPVTGPDAIIQGNWYHVAVTFDGAAAGGTLKFYWTLMEPSRVEAALIGTGTMGNLNPLAVGTPDFAIGNVGRSTPNGAFVGLIDEVRLSKKARAANEMMFNTSKIEVPITIYEQPTNQTVQQGQSAPFRVTAFGTDPLAYQWRFNAVPIDQATNRNYLIPFVAETNIGNYDVVINSSVGSRTSDVAVLAIKNLPVVIDTPPAEVTVAVGQAASFSVSASGTAPFGYQWRFNEQPIDGATSNWFTIDSAQLTNDGNYDVVVTNMVNAQTSTVARLVVRTPLNLSWVGTGNPADWDSVSLFWDSNNDSAADLAYSEGDNVLFGVAGWLSPNVNLPRPVHPLSVLVNSDYDYVFSSTTNGAIVGTSRITKQGFGTLTLDIDNTYTGPTLVESGRLTIGAGDLIGVAATRGTLGTGPVTNQAVLRFDRVGVLTLSNSITGPGELIKDNTLSLRLLGSNTFSGSVTVNRGNLTVGAAAVGLSTNITLNGVGAGDGTSLTLRDGAAVAANATLTANTVDANNRAGILNESGTNSINSAIVISGAGPMIVRSIDGALEINGPISGPAFTDLISFRGAGTNNLIRGSISLPGAGVQKDDGGTWTLGSTGNSFLFLRILAGVLKLGNQDAVATAATLRTDGGVLDLAGHDQTVSGLQNLRATPVTIITNSSGASDSRLTVATSLADAPWVTGCVFADAGPGSRKVSLTLNGGGSLVLTNVSSHSGDTVVNAGTLVLSGNGAIPNSTPLVLAAGTTLDAAARANGTLTLSSGQVCKPNGAVNVLGNMINNGTIEMTLRKSGATTTQDSINGVSTLTYGGTLKLNLTGSPALVSSDAFKLFSAASYAGVFATIVPSVPVPGLAWDTSTLSTDGTLRLKQGAATYPTNITVMLNPVDKSLELSWPAGHLGWTLQFQTNSASTGLTTNWITVSGSATTNRVIWPAATSGCGFYRLIYP